MAFRMENEDCEEKAERPTSSLLMKGVEQAIAEEAIVLCESEENRGFDAWFSWEILGAERCKWPGGFVWDGVTF